MKKKRQLDKQKSFDFEQTEIWFWKIKEEMKQNRTG